MTDRDKHGNFVNVNRYLNIGYINYEEELYDTERIALFGRCSWS